MKNLLLYTTLIIVACCACSKKSSVKPVINATVVINGNTYPTTIIGNQTWTAVNYDGINEGGVAYSNTTDTVTNGLLYTVAEAEAIPLPTGWRVPTDADFSNLIASIGGSDPVVQQTRNLMSANSWTNGGGNNASGFNAIPAGFYGYGDNANQSFQSQGVYAVFVSSTVSGNVPQFFEIYHWPGYMFAAVGQENEQLSERGSLRFVKDN